MSPNTGMFLELFGTQTDQPRSVPIHFITKSRAKPERGISADVSKEIKDYWGILVPTRTGIYGKSLIRLSFPCAFLSLKILKYVLIGLIFLFMFYI